jgi:hypothetical protein
VAAQEAALLTEEERQALGASPGKAPGPIPPGAVSDEELQQTFIAMADRINKEFEALKHYTLMSEEEFAAHQQAPEPAAPAPAEAAALGDPGGAGGPEALDLQYLCRHNPEVVPFAKQARAIRWVKISMGELAALPVDAWAMTSQPILSCAFYTYGHFILGEEAGPERKRFYLGVPHVYEPDDRFVMRRLEFMQFKCAKDTRPAPGEFGYWLMLLPRAL